MTQRQFAALIQKELVKIYLRRGVGRTIVGISSDFAASVKSLTEDNLILKMLLMVAVPFQLGLTVVSGLSLMMERALELTLVLTGWIDTTFIRISGI